VPVLELRDMHLEDLIDVVGQFLLLGEDFEGEGIPPFGILLERPLVRCDDPFAQALSVALAYCMIYLPASSRISWIPYTPLSYPLTTTIPRHITPSQ
jgi:hypothetical protein